MGMYKASKWLEPIEINQSFVFSIESILNIQNCKDSKELSEGQHVAIPH